MRARPRLLSILLWFSAFMSPLYVQGTGFVYDYNLVHRIMSSSMIYGFVTVIWPSLIMHLATYVLVLLSLRNPRYVRYFLAYAGASYILIGLGQSTSFIDGKLASMISNLILVVFIGLLWIRDALSPVEFKGRGTAWFLPLALFAFISPMATARQAPPWSWMWESAGKQPLLAVPALIADSLAGFGPVAYCFFTPLALTVAGRAGALRPMTLRLTSLLGMAFSSIIWAFSIAGISGGWIPPSERFSAMWNAVLHLPLLVICTYYFVVSWEKG